MQDRTNRDTLYVAFPLLTPTIYEIFSALFSPALLRFHFFIDFYIPEFLFVREWITDQMSFNGMCD